MTTDRQTGPHYSIVLPAYGEADALGGVLTRIREVMDSLKESYEIVVVDDGSADGTWTILQHEAEKHPNLQALRLSRNFGKEAALCAGLEVASGEACIVMDADLQHPPAVIPEMIRVYRESGANVVEGVKTVGGSKPTPGTPFFYALLRRLSGFDLKGASDFKLIDRSVRDAWLRMGERNLFFRGMIAWLGFRRVQVPFSVPERVSGQSRWSYLGLVRLALTALTAFSSLPLRLVAVSGSAFFVLAVYLGIDTLVTKLRGQAATGFTTVILLQLIIASLLMFSLAIIGEYIARIYDEVKRRPRYVVSGRIDARAEAVATGARKSAG